MIAAMLLYTFFPPARLIHLVVLVLLSADVGAASTYFACFDRGQRRKIRAALQTKSAA